MTFGDCKINDTNLFTFLYEIPVVIGEKEGKTQNLFIVNKGLLSCQ